MICHVSACGITILFGDLQKKNVQRVKEIKKLIKKKDCNAALKACMQRPNNVPESHDVLFITGGTYYMKKKHKMTIFHFERALQIGSTRRVACV